MDAHLSAQIFHAHSPNLDGAASQRGSLVNSLPSMAKTRTRRVMVYIFVSATFQTFAFFHACAFLGNQKLLGK